MKLSRYNAVHETEDGCTIMNARRRSVSVIRRSEPEAPCGLDAGNLRVLL